MIDEAKDVARRVHMMAKEMMGFSEDLDDVEVQEEGAEEEEEEEEELGDEGSQVGWEGGEAL